MATYMPAVVALITHMDLRPSIHLSHGEILQAAQEFKKRHPNDTTFNLLYAQFIALPPFQHIERETYTQFCAIVELVPSETPHFKKLAETINDYFGPFAVHVRSSDVVQIINRAPWKSYPSPPGFKLPEFWVHKGPRECVSQTPEQRGAVILAIFDILAARIVTSLSRQLAADSITCAADILYDDSLFKYLTMVMGPLETTSLDPNEGFRAFARAQTDTDCARFLEDVLENLESYREEEDPKTQLKSATEALRGQKRRLETLFTHAKGEYEDLQEKYQMLTKEHAALQIAHRDLLAL